MDYNKIIDKYYPKGSELRRILTTHSEQVARRALAIADKHPELDVDREFIFEASMLHDIGIVNCDAPRIQCFGANPYICHGCIGAGMLRLEGFPRHARVCERHTGAGISKAEIIIQNLPLPLQDFLPETLEEKVICYADKFFSKTHLGDERTLEQAEKSVGKFGTDGFERFKKWEILFE